MLKTLTDRNEKLWNAHLDFGSTLKHNIDHLLVTMLMNALNVTALPGLHANQVGLQFTETKQSSRVKKRMRLDLNLAWSRENFTLHAHHDGSSREGGEPLIIYDSRRSSRRSSAPVSPWHLICLKISECAVWSWRVDVRGGCFSSSSSTPEPHETQFNSVLVYIYLCTGIHWQGFGLAQVQINIQNL